MDRISLVIFMCDIIIVIIITTTDHKEGEQLEDRRNVGENSYNFGDGTDQRVQYLMFMLIMIGGECQVF